MTHLAVAVALLLVASLAHATSTVTAGATLEWESFGFSTTGTLTLTGLDVIAFPTITTVTTGPRSQASVSPSGHLAASATAVLSGLPGESQLSRAGATAEDLFWLYGVGTGDLVVTVPYALEVEADSLPAPSDRVQGSASVTMQIGPGVGAYFSDALELDGPGALRRDGVIVLSRAFDTPTWGPLVLIRGETFATAGAAVPEPEGLLGLGLLGVGIVVVHRQSGTRKGA